MSIEALNLVWRHSDSTLGSRLVLLSLADYANDNLQSWPAVETLAKKSKLSERNARLCLRKLEELNEIRIDKNAGPKGCNVYTIIVTRKEGGQNLQGATSNSQGGNIEQKRGAILAPKPSEEPSKEPSSTSPSAADGKAEAESDRKKRHTEFIDLWTKSYKAKFGRDYIFNGGRDGRAVKDMLSASKMLSKDLVDLAWRAWQCRGREFFHCSKAVTIAYFASHLNEVMSELGIASQPPRDSVEDDHEARYGFPRGSIPLSKRPPPFEDDAGSDIGQAEYEKRFPLNLYDHDK